MIKPAEAVQEALFSSQTEMAQVKVRKKLNVMLTKKKKIKFDKAASALETMASKGSKMAKSVIKMSNDS